MDSLITFNKESPIHEVSFWLGVLDGMGIPYFISKDSPIYRPMREYERGVREEIRLARLKPRDTNGDKNGCHVIYSVGDSDCTMSVKRG